MSKKNYVTIDHYDGSFEVSEEWLKQHIDQSIEEFFVTYTWDDGEWLQLEYNAEKEEQEINQMAQLLKQGYSLFKKGDQEGILHDCSKQEGYQFSYFDQYGAIGDIQTQTLDDMARRIHELGFQLCAKSDLTIVS